MSRTYAERRRLEGEGPKAEQAAPQPSMNALRSGLAKPIREQPPVDLTSAMRAKLENAFGGDLSAVRHYESEVPAEGQAVMPTAALSSASAASAAGPIQAKKGEPAVMDGAVLDYSKQKKPESNEAFEKALKGGNTLSGKVASLAGTISDPNGLRKTIGEKAETAGKIERTLGGVFGNESMKEGALTNAASEEAKIAVDWLQQHTDAGAAKKVSDISTLTGSSLSLPTAVMELGDSFDKLEEAKKSGSRSAVANAGFKVASSGIAAAKKGVSFSKNVSDMVSTEAAKAASKGLKTAGKYIGFAGEGVGLLKDIYNVGESTQRRQRMRASAEAMQNAGGTLSEDEQEKLSIFRQGTDSAGQDQKEAGFNLVSHALGLAGTISSSAGAEPLGAGFETAQKVWDALTGEVMSYEKDKFHTDTVEEKLHTAREYDSFQDEARLRAFHVSGDAYRKAMLRAQGYRSGTTDEAFEGISGKRADRLTDAAGKKEGWALEYAGNAGIDTEGVTESDEQKKAIRGAILKSLGGGGKKAEDFHSSNVLEYNAFQKAADEKAEADKHGFGGYIKYKAANFGRGAWESVKTGGRKALSAVKGVAGGIYRPLKRLLTSRDPWVNAWEGLKTGAGKAVGAVKKLPGAIKKGLTTAGSAIRDFVMKPSVRKKAWESLKTGAGKAVRAVGSGIVKAGKYVWNVGKHSVTSRIDKVRNWYQEGVDQMNVHKDTYKQMHVLDRLAWSAKNLPARLLHGTRRNQEATVRRFNRALTADEAVAHMNEFRAGKNPPPAEEAPAPLPVQPEEDVAGLYGLPESFAAQPAEQGAKERPTAFDLVERMFQEERGKMLAKAGMDESGNQLPSERETAFDAADRQCREELANLSPMEEPTEPAKGSLLQQLEAELALLRAPLP